MPTPDQSLENVKPAVELTEDFDRHDIAPFPLQELAIFSRCPSDETLGGDREGLMVI